MKKVNVLRALRDCLQNTLDILYSTRTPNGSIAHEAQVRAQISGKYHLPINSAGAKTYVATNYGYALSDL